ncbi:MAG: hypothetical protein KGK07_10110 [Chloroflexota bacterium]|nr:hypothetical protein [Chloroflexota bacterium]
MACALAGAAFAAYKLVGSGDATAQPDAVGQAKQALDADRAKPPFRGELGGFTVVEHTATQRLCPPPYQPVYDLDKIKASGLYSPLFGTSPQAGACADGRITGLYSFGQPVLYRGYFFGKPQVALNAPAERIRLLTVAGRPAIAELAIPGVPTSTTQVTVIERLPDGTVPGMEVGVVTVSDSERAIALAEEIMMGSP